MGQDVIESKHWMKMTMKAAALYNWVWGIWIILFPHHFFELVGMEPLNHPMIWQGMGMVIGVYGFGYWWASYNPIRHWPIVAVGMMGKVFGPLGFFINYLAFDAPGGFFLTLITNDFIWWVPFAGILMRVHKSIGWKLGE